MAFAIVATAVAARAAAESLESPVLVMYEKVGMNGREIAYSAPVADIDVRYPFHSAAVKSGRWELCTRNNFKGACLDVGPGDEIVSLKKNFGFFARIRSLRPIDGVRAVAAPDAPEAMEIVGAEPAPGSSPDTPRAPVASAEAVLRGHQAYFFKNPMWDGAAIDAADSDAAGAFCREAGFKDVEFSGSASNGGRQVIGDLLCSNALKH